MVVSNLVWGGGVGFRWGLEGSLEFRVEGLGSLGFLCVGGVVLLVFGILGFI